MAGGVADMSDILIKGMEMPRGNNVLVVDSAGTITKVNRWTGKVEATDPFSVKAVALPEHGDLIDRNELPLTWITDHKLDGHTVVEFEDVKNAPVIVEASE